MEEFSFSTRIFFGEGALERLRRVQDKKVMIVTDRFMAGIGVPDKVAGHLTRCQVSVFDGVVPDPPIEVVAAGVQALQDCGAEVMIAVGGGSTIDAAKAIRAVAKQTLHIDTDRWECFAVPTTSGTGSEVTDYAVITDRAKGIKYPLDSQALRPPVAILDPELTVSAPASVTADAGMDVLTHALEAYVSKGANDFSDALCVKSPVCFMAGLISIRMTLFFMLGWFMAANFISVQIPVASMPCGMKLSHIRVIFSGCFLFFDSPDTYSIALMPWAMAFALAIMHRPPCPACPLSLPGNCLHFVRTAGSR